MFSKGKIIAAAALALAVNSAMAADSVDVKVIGTIVPAASTLALEGGDSIDYGTIKADTLAQDDYTVLAEKNLNFSIKCDAAAKISIHGIDARADSIIRPVGKTFGSTTITGTSKMFGLGKADSKGIGSYLMWIEPDTVSLDGTTGADAIFTRTQPTSTAKWEKTDVKGVRPTQGYYYSWAKAGSLLPVAFKTMTGALSVQAAINKGSELDLTKAVHLDGMSTIEVYYL